MFERRKKISHPFKIVQPISRSLAIWRWLYKNEMNNNGISEYLLLSLLDSHHLF
jgi:hypothetical protein